MSTSIQQPPAKFAALKSKIETFFELLAILVIPSLFISSVIISLELLPGVGTFTVSKMPVGQWIGTAAMTAMMLSIEAAMVGCSVIAKHAKAVEDDATKNKYSLFGGLFFLLFVLTVAFQVFKIPALFDPYLTLVRCIAAGAYAYFCHGDSSNENALRPAQVDQIEELRNMVKSLATQLATQKSVQAIQATQIAEHLHKLEEQATQLATQPTQTTDHLVEVGQFNDLATLVNDMRSRFTEVNNTVLQFTQNFYAERATYQATQPTQRNYTTVQETQEAIESTVDQKLLTPPCITVEGIRDVTVQRIISDFLGGVQWREIKGNYSTTVKPVREAYEAYEKSLHKNV
jgi:hypothetical protein